MRILRTWREIDSPVHSRQRQRQAESRWDVMRRQVGFAVAASIAQSGMLISPALARAPVLIHWSLGRVVDVSPRGEPSINGLACPSIRLCVGVDSDPEPG